MKKIIAFLFCIGVFSLAYANVNGIENSDLYTIDAVTVNDEISSLCQAVIKGDVDKVRSLLATGAELNEKSLGLTPAMYAARYNKAEVMKVLLLNGANLNIKSNQGYTAKDYAKQSNAKDVLDVIKAAS
jgi:ankyrin repeat protein